MVNVNAALGHDFFEITIRYLVANIEKHGVQDHVFWEVSAFETDHWDCADLNWEPVAPTNNFVEVDNPFQFFATMPLLLAMSEKCDRTRCSSQNYRLQLQHSNPDCKPPARNV